MTFFAHRLIRISGNENWEEWGAHWWGHVDAITDLWWVDGFWGPPAWLAERDSIYLDWGARLWTVTRAEVLLLIKPRTQHLLPDWDEQNRLIESLPEDDTYGVIWIEETQPHIAPGKRFTSQPDAAISPSLDW